MILSWQQIPSTLASEILCHGFDGVVLDAAWNSVSRGGIIVFDEYAFHKWSESQGVDRFFKDKGVVVKSLNYIAPTAYVVKR